MPDDDRPEELDRKAGPALAGLKRQGERIVGLEVAAAHVVQAVNGLIAPVAGLWRRASRPNPRGWSTGSIASDGFLDTREWARARHEALRANDGRCGLCGRGEHDGARLEVDHIKPRHKRPDLALAVRNLQVLCGPNGCDSGKGGWRSDDWRRPDHPHRPSWRGSFARWRGVLARWW